MDSCFTCKRQGTCGITKASIIGCASWEAVDNLVDSFNIAEIEQMEPEFIECRHCGRIGWVCNGLNNYHCPVCHGTGEVEKEGYPND